jgi:hypothetical protein
MDAGLPHPMTSPEASGASFVALVRGGPEAAWHHRIALPAGYSMEPETFAVPGSEAPTSLGRFRRDDPPAEIEVFGALLGREVDPADWLDASPLVAGARVDSRRVEPAATGARGSVVAALGDGRIARLYAAKWGARLLALRCATDADHYPGLAEELLVTLRSLEPVLAEGGRFAEPMRVESGDAPVPWKTSIPASWKVEPGGGDEDVASFQATNLARPGAPDEEPVGKLAFAVFARGALKRPREVASFYLEALADGGLRVLGDAFEEEPAREPFDHSWLLVSPATRSASLPGEVRCRVMRHDRVWVLAGALSPRAEDDRAAWMQDKRALDVVTQSLRIKG